MEKFAKFLSSRILEIIIAELFIALAIGPSLHTIFAELKTLMPVLVFAMLLQPMFVLELGTALLERIKRKARHIAATIIMYTAIYPLITYMLAKTWLHALPSATYPLLVGTVLVALSPVAMPAPAFVANLGGDVELSVATIVVTFALAPVVIPAYTLAILHRVVHVPVESLIRSIVLYIVAPFVFSQSLRLILARAAGSPEERAYVLRRAGTALAVVSCLALYAVVGIAFGNAAPLIIKMYGTVAAILGILVAYNAARYLVAYAASLVLKAGYRERIALLYTASQNGALGMALAAGVAGVKALSGAVIAGPLTVLLTMSIAAKLVMHKRG